MHFRSTHFRLFTSVILVLSQFTAIPTTFAEEQKGFWDVPADHFAYDAVIFLKEKGMIAGYEDGSFRPEKKVNRAEALKIIAAPLLAEKEAKQYTTSSFSDVTKNEWFLPYVEWARTKEIINGPPKAKNFYGARTVTKVEFIKMFLISRDTDPKQFNDIQLSLSRDTVNTKDWYYPYLRYAIASSMTIATKENLYQPQRELTRGDVAVLIYRYLLYKQGERSQVLLSEAKREVENTINQLSAGNAKEAEYASARGLLVTRGALAIKADEPVVKVAVKIAEGCRALTRAYRAALNEDWDDVVKLSKDAWYLGEQAKKIDKNATTVANQLQKYAQSFADQARVNGQ